MPRLVLALPLAFALLQPPALAAQPRLASPSRPTFDAVRAGVTSSDAVAARDAGMLEDSSASTRAPDASRAAVVANRRGQFAKAGAVLGIVGGYAWLLSAGNRDPLTVIAVVPVGFLLLPVVATTGAAIGYGVSFLVYPPVHGAGG